MIERSGFETRRTALENAFFQNRDAELIAKMREELSRMEEKLKLANVSGILNEKVLLDLVQVGVRAETLLAMRLVPMVAVAWADRILTPEERAAILRAASDVGIVPETAAYGLLAAWLERSPDKQVVTAWREYVVEAAKIMPAEALAELRARTDKLCNLVAKAAGGVLGIRSISPVEQAAINEFVGAFDQSKSSR